MLLFKKYLMWLENHKYALMLVANRQLYRSTLFSLWKAHIYNIFLIFKVVSYPESTHACTTNYMFVRCEIINWVWHTKVLDDFTGIVHSPKLSNLPTKHPCYTVSLVISTVSYLFHTWHYIITLHWSHMKIGVWFWVYQLVFKINRNITTKRHSPLRTTRIKSKNCCNFLAMGYTYILSLLF